MPTPSIGLPIDAAGVGPSGIWLDLQCNALTVGVEVFQMQQDGVIPPDQLRRLAATAISEGKLPADSSVHGSPFTAHHDTTCLLCRLAFAGEPVQLLVGQNRVALLHVRCFRAWLDVIWPNDGADDCGDCGEAIDDDSVIVAVDEDRFHASCYLPPAALDRLEEMQSPDEFTREDDRDAKP